MPPIIRPTYQAKDRFDALSFQDLIELLFVAGFRSEGLSLQHIREAARIAAQKYRRDHPFSLKRFSTDGRRIFATVETNDPNASTRSTEDVVSGQLVFRRVMSLYLRQLEYDVQTGDTIRWWPLGRSSTVAVDPRRSFGAPIDHKSGVPTDSLFKAYQAEGGGRDALIRAADWFQVPPETVRAAVDFEKELSNRAA